MLHLKFSCKVLLHLHLLVLARIWQLPEVLEVLEKEVKSRSLTSCFGGGYHLMLLLEGRNAHCIKGVTAACGLKTTGACSYTDGETDC
jgi:hypothetical protein